MTKKCRDTVTLLTVATSFEKHFNRLINDYSEGEKPSLRQGGILPLVSSILVVSRSLPRLSEVRFNHITAFPIQVVLFKVSFGLLNPTVPMALFVIKDLVLLHSRYKQAPFNF